MRRMGKLVGILKSQLFGWAILACAAISFSFPSAFTSWGGVKLTKLITPAIQVIMFGMGTTLTLAGFVRVVKCPWAVAAGVFLQFLVMPIVGFSLAHAFGFSGGLAAGCFLVGSVAGGTASNVIAYLTKANVALSVTMTCCSTLLSPFVTPDPEQNSFVRGLFHKSMKVPSCWIVWAQESNGVPETLQAGWELCPSGVGRTIVRNLEHSHNGFSVVAVHRMARYFAGLDTRLPRLSLGRRDGHTMSAEILDAGKGVTEALLWYTRSPPVEFGHYKENRKTEWLSFTAEINGNVVSAVLPKDAQVAYLSSYEAEQPDARRRVAVDRVDSSSACWIRPWPSKSSGRINYSLLGLRQKV